MISFNSASTDQNKYQFPPSRRCHEICSDVESYDVATVDKGFVLVASCPPAPEALIQHPLDTIALPLIFTAYLTPYRSWFPPPLPAPPLLLRLLLPAGGGPYSPCRRPPGTARTPGHVAAFPIGQTTHQTH